jgi:hypothetical protein
MMFPRGETAQTSREVDHNGGKTFGQRLRMGQGCVQLTGGATDVKILPSGEARHLRIRRPKTWACDLFLGGFTKVTCGSRTRLYGASTLFLGRNVVYCYHVQSPPLSRPVPSSRGPSEKDRDNIAHTAHPVCGAVRGDGKSLLCSRVVYMFLTVFTPCTDEKEPWGRST